MAVPQRGRGRTSALLLAGALLVAALALSFAGPAEGRRGRLRAAVDEDADFERYAVRVTRAAEGLGRRARRGRALLPEFGGGACLAGQAACGTTCTSLAADPSNCGTCGNICDATEECCGGACVSLQTDFKNCGACNSTCAVGSCVAGLCGY